jgi:predicted ATP-grasp superfamily ATP-dependent carboligase
VVGYLDAGSTSLGVLTFQKLRQYPFDYGSGSLNQAIWMSELSRIAIEFLQKIDYHGAFGAEYKRIERDGQYKLSRLMPD